MRRGRQRRAVAFAVALAGAAGLAAAAGRAGRDPYFRVRRIEIAGTGYRLQEADVRAWLDVREGMPIWDVDARQWQRRLRQHPLVARAAVRRRLPASLRIEIEERKPVALLMLERPWYVDASGVAFLSPSPHDDLDYPVITGVDPRAPAPYRSWLVRRALEAARLVATFPVFGAVSEVRVGPRGGVTVYPTGLRAALVLGREDWEAKIARAARVAAALPTDAARLAVLDLRFRGRVVVRFRHRAPGAEQTAGRKLVT